MSSWRILLAAMAVIALSAVTGCREQLTRVMVEAPNQGQHRMKGSIELPEDLRARVTAKNLRVIAGRPPANLATVLLTPEGGDRRAPVVMILRHTWDPEPPRVGPFAESFLDAGYRVLLVDVRGCGHSSGNWFSYGAREAADLAAVVEQLWHELDAPIAIFGTGYAGSLALHAATREPRITTVVAVAPFRSYRAAIPEYLRSHFIRNLFMTQGGREQVITDAAALASFDPDDADLERALRGKKFPFLLLHGADDRRIPTSHSEALVRAPQGRAKLIILKDLNHNETLRDRTEIIREECKKWFAEYLHP